jgi:uncharacterized membrane protein YoaK (UPF0700 family)
VTSSRGFLLGLALTALAGWIDAAGFLEFSGFSISFMSGNMVQVGLDGARADVTHVTRALGAMALFVFGSFAGGLMFARCGRWMFAVSLAVLASALALAAGLALANPAPALAIVPLALAMGLQNQIVSKTRDDNAGTTFVTGTLFRFGDLLAQIVLGAEQGSRAVRLLAVVAAFALGAAAGAIHAVRYGAWSFVPPAAFAAMVAMIALGQQAGREIARRHS